MRKIEIKDLGGGNSNILYFHPYLGKRFPIWLIFFKGDWNCQPVKDAWMCLIKRNYAQQDRDQSDEGGAADDAFLWQLGAASQKKRSLKRPQFPFGNGRVVAWYGRKIVCHPKIGGKITGIDVPSGGTLEKKSMATVSESCWKPQRRESRIAWVYSSKMTSNKKDDHSQDTRYPRVIINCFTTMVLGYSTKSGNSFCLSFGDDDAVFIHLGTLMVILWMHHHHHHQSCFFFRLSIKWHWQLWVQYGSMILTVVSGQKRWFVEPSHFLPVSMAHIGLKIPQVWRWIHLLLWHWHPGLTALFFKMAGVTNQNPPIHVPSWELTYPIKNYFWRWFSFSQGGIC